MWLHKTQDKESAEAALKEIETSTDSRHRHCSRGLRRRSSNNGA